MGWLRRTVATSLLAGLGLTVAWFGFLRPPAGPTPPSPTPYHTGRIESVGPSPLFGPGWTRLVVRRSGSGSRDVVVHARPVTPIAGGWDNRVRVGQVVSVWHSGLVMQTDPVQVEAAYIRVDEDRAAPVVAAERLGWGP